MTRHGTMTQLAIILVFGMCTLRAYDAVSIKEGEITGTTMMTRKGREISAFLGIPYAEPPVGPLRFKSPVRKSKFDSVLPGDTDGNVCPQLNDDGELIGDEDCLFLNVYTPKAVREPLYPVMVYFHGGMFRTGSGSSTEVGPQYLLDRDIVLVTFNYRLGAFGFLSTFDEQAPGNFGLKDQWLVLHWVQDNIIAFGGDPKKVTIFGNEAGGASTSSIAAAYSDSGMFQKYIFQSGSGTAFWAYYENGGYERYDTYAPALGNKLGCDMRNNKTLINCLREADVYDIVNSDDIFSEPFWLFNTWTPTVERGYSKDAFLDTSPLLYYLFGDPHDIPVMMGITANAGLSITADLRTNETFYNQFRSEVDAWFRHLVLLVMREEDPAVQQRFAPSMKELYLKNVDPDDKEAFIQGITNSITDSAFKCPVDWELTFSKNLDSNEETTSPTYAYSFDYRGTFSHSSLATGNNDNIGVAHDDELIYLFPLNPKLKTSPDVQFSESDEKMIDIMVDLWTSFAATSTPVTNSTSSPVNWKNYNNEVSNYLQIGNQSNPQIYNKDPWRDDRIMFWTTMINSRIYESYILGSHG